MASHSQAALNTLQTKVASAGSDTLLTLLEENVHRLATQLPRLMRAAGNICCINTHLINGKNDFIIVLLFGFSQEHFLYFEMRWKLELAESCFGVVEKSCNFLIIC